MKNIVALSLAFALCLPAIYLQQKMATYDTRSEDVYYSWLEGKRIINGENPYERVLEGDMRENKKYATYFPLFYLLSGLTQLAGLEDYADWIGVWRWVFLIFNLGIGFLIFRELSPRKGAAFALLGLGVWLYNRWTLHLSLIAHLDFPPIFFFILSLVLLRRHFYPALLLFSLSLALKQIAIFAGPLYLVWAWQRSSEKSWRQPLIAAGLIASLPLLCSAPFLIWNAEGFLRSILFSATRNAASFTLGATADLAVDSYMGWVGLGAKLPMLALMGLVYWAAWRKQIGKYGSAFLVMFIFLTFNSVHFRQYFCWVVPFVMLAFCDAAGAEDGSGELEESW